MSFVVHSGEINILAIHTVRHAAMSRNTVAKVFDVECAFKTRSKETSKWCDQRSKDSKDKQMKLIRDIGNDCHGTAKLQMTRLAHEQSSTFDAARTSCDKKTLNGAQISHSLAMKTGLGTH